MWRQCGGLHTGSTQNDSVLCFFFAVSEYIQSGRIRETRAVPQQVESSSAEEGGGVRGREIERERERERGREKREREEREKREKQTEGERQREGS